MHPAQHVRAADEVGCGAGLAEELRQHPAVALDGAERAGAALLLGEEGVQGLLPA